MRRTIRLLASVKPRFLEPNTPTGLAGLLTHPAPRSTLLYLYSSTLEKLQAFPDNSLYRTSTEALTKHRMNIVNSVVPEGYEAWAANAKKIIEDHPEVFNTPEGGVHFDGGKHVKATISGKTFVVTKADKERDEVTEEWDGEENNGPELEGTRSASERAGQKILGLKRPGEDTKNIRWEPEPPLTADQYVSRG